MNLQSNYNKTTMQRRKRFLENLDNFERGFKAFINLPADKMVITRFRDRILCREELGYDGDFCEDYQIYKAIKTYYRTGKITPKIKFLVPCKDIYDRLNLIGFVDFDLAKKQQELRDKKMQIRFERGEVPINMHITGEPFDVNKFLKAYALFMQSYQSFNEYKKNNKLKKSEYRNVDRDFNRENSVRFLGYPRSFAADLLNVRRAYFYGACENTEISFAMQNESVVKALQDGGFDFSLRFASYDTPFNGEEYALALSLYKERYGNIDVPSSYDFACARRELNYCGDLGAHHALVKAVLAGKVKNDDVSTQLQIPEVKNALEKLGVISNKKVATGQQEAEVPFEFKAFLNAFKAYRAKYKTSEISPSFDEVKSKEEFGYPRSLFVDASMIFEAYHKKPVKDKKIAQVAKSPMKMNELKGAKFDFWPQGFTR